jgi:hypothetical protein
MRPEREGKKSAPASRSNTLRKFDGSRDYPDVEQAIVNQL